MPANTKRVVAFLAVFALIVATVNIYRWINPYTGVLQSPQATPTPETQLLLTPAPTPKELVFSSADCGISLAYPPEYSTQTDASGSAILTAPDNANAIFITCNEDESASGLSGVTWESVTIASVSARLYSQTTEGVTIQTLRIVHPDTKKVIYIAGSGQTYEDSLNSLLFTKP